MLSKIWPFCLLLPAPKLEFVNGIPRSPQAKQTFRKFWDMSAEEIEALPVDPELEKIFETFEEMSEVIENASYHHDEARVDFSETMENGEEYLPDFVPYSESLIMCETGNSPYPPNQDLRTFSGSWGDEIVLVDGFVPYGKSLNKIQWRGEVQGKAQVRASGRYSTSQQNIIIFKETNFKEAKRCQSPMYPKSVRGAFAIAA